MLLQIRSSDSDEQRGQIEMISLIKKNYSFLKKIEIPLDFNSKNYY
jgi:hypothetical protein